MSSLISGKIHQHSENGLAPSSAMKGRGRFTWLMALPTGFAFCLTSLIFITKSVIGMTRAMKEG